MQAVALVGRPNVGKSTLFNQLTKTRDAIVHDAPGVTRDRVYGLCNLNPEKSFLVVDTGGLQRTEDHEINALMLKQAKQAMQESALIVFIVDARAGINALDSEIANQIRQFNKPVLLIANKTDGLKNPDQALAEFCDLGFGLPIGIAASHARGLQEVLEAIAEKAGLNALENAENS
ncbi:MAG: GTPase, partial [Gammaproteobacteria bacterium]